MKTRITAITLAVAALTVSFCVADSTGHWSDSDSLVALRKDLRQTQSALDQLMSRTALLEQRISGLEQSNAQLQQEMRMFQGRNPQLPPGGTPPGNQTPHLTPLQTPPMTSLQTQ